MKVPTRKRLSEVLVAQGRLTPAAVAEALQAVGGEERRLAAHVSACGLVSDEHLAEALADQVGCRYCPLTAFQVDPAAFQRVPAEAMYRYPFVPYEERDGVLVIALADPTDLRAVDELEILLDREVEVVVSPRAAILEALKRSEGSAELVRRIGTEYQPALVREETESPVLSPEAIARDGSPVIRLVDTFILDALERRASDIHLEATDRALLVKYRVDGVLYQPMEPLDLKFHQPVVSRIKVMSELDITERRVPQDGRFRLRVGRKVVDFRISIMPSIHGEDVVIRILDKDYITQGVGQLALQHLGFNEADLRRFRGAITEPYGMALVTGPTGSGKTTTLYAAISEINTGEDKIITIEDPVEYELSGVVQIPVNEKKGLTFARGLRSILRHNPDKIMVGEIRDAETAQIAIQSALTGHLVFTTVHANNAFDVIGRFVNMGIEPYNFVSSLNCILAQRLVRQICTACPQPVTLAPAALENSGLDPRAVAGRVFYEGKGCAACHGSGYRGRQAITEFLALTDTIRAMILERRPPAEIRRQAMAEGLTTLRQAGLDKVFRGITTLREINRVTFIEAVEAPPGPGDGGAAASRGPAR